MLGSGDGLVAGEELSVAGGGRITVLEPFEGSERLVVATLDLPPDVGTFLARHGHPIRYRHVPQPWPLSAYQTVFSTEPGSAEMPSAGRPFTNELVTRLVTAGVGVAPVVLHTGVSSLEGHEPPYPERYRVPLTTADAVNATRRAGHRVVAVGTTVVRALETVAHPNGLVTAGTGWTDLVLGPERPARAVGGLVTGWHEPRSSHLRLLESIAPVRGAGGGLPRSGGAAVPVARVRRHPPAAAVRSAGGMRPLTQSSAARVEDLERGQRRRSRTPSARSRPVQKRRPKILASNFRCMKNCTTSQNFTDHQDEQVGRKSGPKSR